MYELQQLLKKKFITYEELEYIQINEEVGGTNGYGSSSIYNGYEWYEVQLMNEKIFDVYVK